MNSFQIIIVFLLFSNKIKKTKNTTLPEQFQNPIEKSIKIEAKSILLKV
jgi:hypothetical protein